MTFTFLKYTHIVIRKLHNLISTLLSDFTSLSMKDEKNLIQKIFKLEPAVIPNSCINSHLLCFILITQ